MKIDQLPIEMLIKIFSFLPKYNEVSLVNKLFYDVACKVNDPNIWLKVDNYFFNQEWLPSVMNSTRQISKVDITVHSIYNLALPPFIAVIRKFSVSIKYLKLHMDDPVGMSEFMEILSLIPNAEVLVCSFYRVRSIGLQDMPSLAEMSNDDDLNLHQLKSLHFSCDSPDLWAVFNRLPVGVLRELSICKANLNAATNLFKRQTNIKRVEFFVYEDGGSASVSNVFDNLELESLFLWYSRCNNLSLCAALAKQTKLKSLNLNGANVDVNVLNVVANQLTELTAFSTDLSEASLAAPISKLSKLRRLQEFSLLFHDGERDELEAFSKLSSPGITTLTVRSDCEPGLVRALAKSVPNLKVLIYEKVIDERELFNSVLTNFNFVEALDISADVDHDACNRSDCFNPKLTQLSITLTTKMSFLDKLIADYPNLKKFKTDASIVSSAQFRRILNGFTKLESLELQRGAQELTMDDLNYLKDHKNSLKSITLNNFPRPDERTLRELSVDFGVVTFGPTGRFSMTAIGVKSDRR